MRIRRFRAGDEAALLAVFQSSIRQIASDFYSAEQIDAWSPATPAGDPDWAARMTRLDPFVAELDGSVVGYADLQDNGYIDHFFVSGEHPRRGIGRALMQQLHAHAATLQLAELSADVSRSAEAFFASAGFEVVERRMPVRHGVTMANALMRKRLAP
ncbi:acetyltransferase [Pseudoxanthomonas dokdonensis]|uniref:Acetyltransferase n=1 Tax=Pseudoxanthomonas dokdonensis TaxID=344882 RepID=A0A0R0CJI7_9GAMM|nr:acetyltransferase [Pseudoxanthomonas dokdonensis]